MTFNYDGKTYSSTGPFEWSIGYVLLPDGRYLYATWIDGKPENIHQRKPFVAPKTYAVATEGNGNAS